MKFERRSLPDRITGLWQLAFNLRWTWHKEAREVFRRLDYPLWRLTSHNPVRMLHLVANQRLKQAARDPAFVALYDAAVEGLGRALTAKKSWWARTYPGLPNHPIAYFSAEFALHQSLPIYAGGLGVLAGDHCKEASDLGIPLVGVGFMYPQGYFHQSITSSGQQEELYEHVEWDRAPVEQVVTKDGTPCTVAVALANRVVHVSVWCVRVGAVKIYLLDTSVAENEPADRELTDRLYGGDRETRLKQEIILGIGGVRVLRVLGYQPGVWHLNEGHTAFVALERMREFLDRGDNFDSALEKVRRCTIFTTHTPVAAGHDTFPMDLVASYLAEHWGNAASQRDEFLRLGYHDNGVGPMFNMTALAIRSANVTNAVSQAHQRVTLDMWSGMWAGTADKDTPLKTITNGVHVPTWIAPDMARLFERYLGVNWMDRHDAAELRDGISMIPDEDLWAVREALRSYLIAFIRERARQLWTQKQMTAARVVAAGTLLDPAALTIGFARRFTDYKRPELVFHDPERLIRILTAFRRPVQIVFAGKAHPADEPGKHHLQSIFSRAIDPGFGGRIAFVEDYDLHVAHFLVQGCDVWLNTPRKPFEASGTSGMKASLNGVLHLSTDDGWWAEGYTGSNGWLIDGGVAEDPAAVDAADAEVLYRLLEEAVVPTFYERDANKVPQSWLQMVKEAICTTMPRFSARRMVKQYSEWMYAPRLQ
ncbi:MAG TPA: alpha-glucan family phosphorylase [Candidatus Binatia bacterium]|nr:alpha-glucan family phosphorylase [Candidatus Binatia bacterium]